MQLLRPDVFANVDGAEQALARGTALAHGARLANRIDLRRDASRYLTSAGRSMVRRIARISSSLRAIELGTVR